MNNNFKDHLNYMNQFKFNHKDMKAFDILNISVGIKWEKIQEKMVALRNICR